MAAILAAAFSLSAQDTQPQKQSLEHIIGAVTAVNSGAHTVTVKEDKSGTEHTIFLIDTKTLLKVSPGAKDLKSAVRISADDLAIGDRVDVRGVKPSDNPDALAAKSVVLMSARDLQQAHQAQADAWAHSTAGVVSSVDPATSQVNITVKSADGAKPLVVETAKDTEFTRYDPLNPKTPALSQLAQIQVGDQIRVIGEKNADGSSVAGRRVYTGAFRTISATISTIAPDGKSVTAKDLATKRSIEVSVTDDTTVHKLPPMMAMMLARRFNPNFKMAASTDGGGRPGANGGSAPSPDVKPSEATPATDATAPNASRPSADGQDRQQSGAGSGSWQGTGRPAGGGGGMRSGDISQMLERLPKITLAELKPGDAVVISGVATGTGGASLLASSIIAGVEPILQSAPQRKGGQSVGGDWGLGEMNVPQ